MMNSKRNLKRGKSGDLLLNSFLGIVCTVLFFGLIAYSYRIFFTGQSAALSPEFISEMNKLYTDQRVKITDFSTSSSSFINAYSACKFKPSVQVPLSMQFEVQRLKSVQEDFISNFDETSRKLIVSAFKPFVGVGLEEKGIVKDEIAILSQFAKLLDKPDQTCDEYKYERLRVEMAQLASALSNNVNKADNLKYRYLLDVASGK